MGSGDSGLGRVQVEEGPWYDEDPWDDWDWEGPDEPQVTYKQAVESLRALSKDHADIRVEWNGRRGPRSDARIVFEETAGNGGLRVRMRSGAQLEDLKRIITSATPLADNLALWYQSERIITARLVGDYDQFRSAVARKLVPHASRRVDPNGPLGRDVAGILASVGAFCATEKAGTPGSDPRTIRLIAANPDLRLLYGPHAPEIPSVAIELARFSVPDAAQAAKLLQEFATAYLYKLGKATGVSLRLFRSEDRIGSRRRPADSGDVRFPKRRYDQRPAELYAAGNSAARDPVERYLKYFQVLEFYMPKAANFVAAAQKISVDQATSPLRPPPNRLGAEKNKLDAVISEAVSQAQVASLLGDNDLFAALSNPKVIQDVEVLGADASGHPVASHDYRLEISKRIYDVRTRIVHMKEGGGPGGKALLAPYSREARDLAADVRLVRFLAEHAMERWSEPLS